MAEIIFARKYQHSFAIIVLPVYILALGTVSAFLIQVNHGERLSYILYRLYSPYYMVFHMIYFRIGFIVTLHLAIVFIIGIIDSQGEPKSLIWTLITRDYSVAPSGGDSNPLILEFVHFVNLICVIAFVETTYIDKCVTSEEVPPCLIRLSRAIDW